MVQRQCCTHLPRRSKIVEYSLTANLPILPQLCAAGPLEFSAVEGETHEKEMTRGQLMKDLDISTRRYAVPTSSKCTGAQLQAQVGKETGVMFLLVPPEWVKGGNSVGNRQQIANKVGPLFDDVHVICCRVHVGEYSGKPKPIGAVSTLTQKLSKGGADRLARGYT